MANPALQDSGTWTPTNDTIESSTNATPIVVTMTGHPFADADDLYIVDHATNTNANGERRVNTPTANTIELTTRADANVAGNGVGGATGTVLKVEKKAVATVAVAGAFSLGVDVNALAAGDVVEISAEMRLLTGGTVRQAFHETLYGDQLDEIWHSDIVPNDLAESGTLVFYIKQTHGVARAFPWEVLIWT